MIFSFFTCKVYVCILLYIYIEEAEMDIGRVGEGGSGNTYMSCTCNTYSTVNPEYETSHVMCGEWLQEMPPFLQLLNMPYPLQKI